jgi:hypothetical protein
MGWTGGGVVCGWMNWVKSKFSQLSPTAHHAWCFDLVGSMNSGSAGTASNIIRSAMDQNIMFNEIKALQISSA